MSKVTGKDCIAYFEANREYFPSKFTVETVKHHLLNFTILTKNNHNIKLLYYS